MADNPNSFDLVGSIGICTHQNFVVVFELRDRSLCCSSSIRFFSNSRIRSSLRFMVSCATNKARAMISPGIVSLSNHVASRFTDGGKDLFAYPVLELFCFCNLERMTKR